jgi:AraC family transcriptional activator of pobA
MTLRKLIQGKYCHQMNFLSILTSMVHKKHPEALGFLSQKSVPLLQLNDEEVQTLYRMMFFLKEMNRNNRHPFKEDMIHHGFNLFMLEAASIAKKYRGHEEHGLTRKENILMNFLKQLTDHFNEERSVQFYASALFISPRHLTKTVKELTTKTCSELIDEMVITETKILLGEMSYSIGQVADLLHFSNKFIFSKFFKNRTGLSPKEYRY